MNSIFNAELDAHFFIGIGVRLVGFERIRASPQGYLSIHGALVPHRRKAAGNWLPQVEAWQLGGDTAAGITLGQKTGCNNTGYPRELDGQTWNMFSWMNKIKPELS